MCKALQAILGMLTPLLPIRLAQQALDVVAGATVEDCDRGSAGFPAQSVGVPKPVCVRGRLSGLSHGMPLAGRTASAALGVATAAAIRWSPATCCSVGRAGARPR